MILSVLELRSLMPIAMWLRFMKNLSAQIPTMQLPGFILWQKCCELAKTIERSQRGEFEVTSLNEIYLKNNKLNIQILGRGFAWLDAGTHESLLEASLFVSTIEKRQGLKIACLEEISWRNGWIDNTELKTLIDQQDKTEYRRYLEKLINGINYQSWVSNCKNCWNVEFARDIIFIRC